MGSKRWVRVMMEVMVMVEVIVTDGWMHMCGLYDDDMRWLLHLIENPGTDSITTKQIDCKLSVFGNLQITKCLLCKFKMAHIYVSSSQKNSKT